MLAIWLDLVNTTEKEPNFKNAVELSKLIENKLILMPLQKNNLGQEKLILLSEFDQRETLEKQYQSYIEQQWQPWVKVEKMRRKSIKLYSELFTLKHQLEGAITDSQLELVWGIGIALWQKNGLHICYPLITQLVEIKLNNKNMALEIRPREETEPQLELDIYIDNHCQGINELDIAYKSFISNQPQTITPFDNISYETVLQLAVTNLDPKGKYISKTTDVAENQLPKASDALQVTDTWVLFARPRGNNVIIQDLENFKKQLENTTYQLTSNIVNAIVTEPASEHKTIITPSFRGISTFDNSTSSESKKLELYFPLPFNEEQLKIIELLECYDGVVVQGLPGTGKSHTITNIITHYLANGKRVLVTSYKDPALSILKEKLPESIRPLAIALLANEPDGMKQFEFAITKIAQELQKIDRVVLVNEIEQIEKCINELHALIAYIDRSINEWANNNIEPFEMDNEHIYPHIAAKEVMEKASIYEWLNDSISIENQLDIDNSDIIRLREARQAIRSDLYYLSEKLPEIIDMPKTEELLNIHYSLIQHDKLQKIIEENGVALPNYFSETEFIKINTLHEQIFEIKSIKNVIKTAHKPWVKSIEKLLNNSDTDRVIKLLDQLIIKFNTFNEQRLEFLAKPVDLPNELEISRLTIDAVSNKANRKSSFSLSKIFNKNQYDKLIARITILGLSPQNADDWHYVTRYMHLQENTRRLILWWNDLSRDTSMSMFTDTNPINVYKHITNEVEIYQLILKLNGLQKSINENMKMIFPSCQIFNLIKDDAKLKELQKTLEQNIGFLSTLKALEYKEKLQHQMNNYKGPLIESIKKFISSLLGNPEVIDQRLQSEWLVLLEELRRIHNLNEYFTTIKDVCKKIKDAGGLNWSKKLQTECPNSTTDNLLPDNWNQVWRLCRLANYLTSKTNYEDFKKLIIQRSESQQHLAINYQEIAAKRIWLKLAEKATPEIKAALQAYLAAVTKIGKGKGKRAIRYRRDAKNASILLNKAIPCWIMSHYKISETLPSQFGCFDLVIIDEASQSDLCALPAIFRAQKLLIVGDDKQVSPEGIGLEEDRINHLMTKYLANQVEIYRQEMSPERSIFDFCKVVFADSNVMLLEHFRCVQPIIEYSKREFYNNELKPLRLPKASERLDPPLIDTLIEDGFRNGKENPAEAQFIVSEIRKICNDASTENSSIGVVSLLGIDQALRIWEMLEQEIGPELISKHNITCGDARTFQGAERNIMFLSMVVTPDDNKADNRVSTEHRFNVSASRARDRMYLVRSVELDDLSPVDSLRRGLIKHFESPFLQDEQQVQVLRDLCESDFEREMYDLLAQRGYKITPQVHVGSYRIDLVVEGLLDRRLAIECDGDRYHSSDKWEDDMVRQRTLERVGWQFWRCFASTFVMHKQNVINDLINTLTEHGIEPIGSDNINNNIHTLHKRIKALVSNDDFTKL